MLIVHSRDVIACLCCDAELLSLHEKPIDLCPRKILI